MAYDFIITDGRHGSPLDLDGLRCSVGYELHEHLTRLLDSGESRFPHLIRFRDHYKDGFVGHESLELLIAEIEMASSRTAQDSPLRPFFGSLHSFCCIALARDGSISGYCD